jgi:hypothetical protein
MVSNYIFPIESTTCFKNLTSTPLTTFSTVSVWGVSRCNLRRGAAAWADEGVRPSIKRLV